jgi:hypothetical protein
MKTYPELMGMFGLTWEEKVAALVYSKLQTIDKKLAKKMKDFFQAGGFNIRLIQNMQREYAALMAQGYKPANYVNGVPDKLTPTLITIIKNKVNTEDQIVSAFLSSLQELAANGIIPFAKWNPKGYEESTNLQKSFESEKTILDKAQTVAKTTAMASSTILLVAGLGFLSYLIYEKRR